MVKGGGERGQGQGRKVCVWGGKKQVASGGLGGGAGGHWGGKGEGRWLLFGGGGEAGACRHLGGMG